MDNVAISSASLNEHKQSIITSVASAIPAHLPTPPPSRSSGGSPVTQVQYPVRQQSPLTTSKYAQPITEITQKRLSDGAIQSPITQPTQEHVSPIIQQQSQKNVRLEITSPLVNTAPVQLPPNMAQIQKQLLAQHVSLSERDFAVNSNDMMAKKQQFMQPNVAQQPATTTIQSSFAQPTTTPQRSRAGSQSTGTPIQQRKSGVASTVSASPIPSQQFNAGHPNVTAATQPANTSQLQAPITTNPQTVIAQNNDLAYIGHLSQMLSMNPAVNNPIIMQQLISSPQFLSQLPTFAANPQTLEPYLRQFQQVNQQTAEFEKLTRQVVQIVGPNATPQIVNQTIMAMIQQEQQEQHARQQQEQELVEKQKQILLSRYETACRGNQMIVEDLARRQAMQQQFPTNQPVTSMAAVQQLPVSNKPLNQRFDVVSFQ